MAPGGALTGARRCSGARLLLPGRALVQSKGKAQSVKFVAAGPKVTVDTSERLAVYADQLNAYKDNSGRSVKGAAFDFIVTDTDSAFKDMSGTLTSSGKSFGSGFVKGIKGGHAAWAWSPAAACAAGVCERWRLARGGHLACRGIRTGL